MLERRATEKRTERREGIIDRPLLSQDLLCSFTKQTGEERHCACVCTLLHRGEEKRQKRETRTMSCCCCCTEWWCNHLGPRQKVAMAGWQSRQTNPSASAKTLRVRHRTHIDRLMANQMTPDTSAPWRIAGWWTEWEGGDNQISDTRRENGEEDENELNNDPRQYQHSTRPLTTSNSIRLDTDFSLFFLPFFTKNKNKNKNLHVELVSNDDDAISERTRRHGNSRLKLRQWQIAREKKKFPFRQNTCLEEQMESRLNWVGKKGDVLFFFCCPSCAQQHNVMGRVTGRLSSLTQT